MNILITGANFYNKGAELMLLSLIKSINRFIGNATICVNPFFDNRAKLNELNIKILDYPLFHYGNKKYFYLSLKAPFLVKLLMKLRGVNTNGDIPLNEIDVVMDISGFAFGDKWGKRPLRDLSLLSEKIKKNGGIFILLPQAFGSFSKPKMSNYINKVVKNVDLVIARDEQSLEYIQKATKYNPKNLFTYPDITLTFKEKIKIGNSEFKEPFCVIVPNEMMLRKSAANWINNYVNVFTKILEIILNQSTINVIILIHAQGLSKDEEIGKNLANNVSKQNSKRVKIFNEDNPIRLKAIIAKSQFIIGSRFHALASALSCNVPAISTSWLHKYEMLFKEYRCENYNFKNPNDDIYNKTKELLNPINREKIAKILKEVNSNLEEKNEEMWNLILTNIYRD